MQNQKPIAITLGEPAGIGPDIVLKLMQQHSFSKPYVIIGNRRLLQERADALKMETSFFKKNHIIDFPLAVPCTIGQPNVQNSGFVLAMLEHAIAGCLADTFSGMVTGPVHKATIKKKGVDFTGHTEYLAERTRSSHVVMMFADGNTRLTLLTTHLPLRAVASHITAEKLSTHILTLQHHLMHRCHITQPKIIVNGLNPHAGEEGHLGDEEIRIIQPTLQKLRQQNPMLDLIGPVAADSAFYQAQQHRADCILSMYHDQSLPVLKTQAFHRLVNITLGLPFIRTSVDHGTAFDIAGTGRADERSLVAAVHYAIRLSESK